MRSVVAWWVAAGASPFRELPIREVVEHAERNGWLDTELTYLCLRSSDDDFRAMDGFLRERGLGSHDLRKLRDEVSARLPWLRARTVSAGSHILDCFIRWEVIREFLANEPAIAWDADIFLNARLSQVESALRGCTGTASSTCFVALHDGSWLETVSSEMARFEAMGDRYLAEMNGHYLQLWEQGRIGFPDDSMFGRRIADALVRDGCMLGVFDFTPEEIFVDCLLRSGRLVQDWSLRLNGHLVCPQLLTLPEAAWVSALPGEGSFRLEVPLGFDVRSGRYYVGNEPLLFLHFQGCLFRLCTAHWIWERCPDLQPRPRPRLKSSLYSGDLEGIPAETVCRQFAATYGAEPSDVFPRGSRSVAFPGISAGGHLPRAEVARRFLLDGQLTEVLNADNLDHSALWRRVKDGGRHGRHR